MALPDAGRSAGDARREAVERAAGGRAGALAAGKQPGTVQGSGNSLRRKQHSDGRAGIERNSLRRPGTHQRTSLRPALPGQIPATIGGRRHQELYAAIHRLGTPGKQRAARDRGVRR